MISHGGAGIVQMCIEFDKKNIVIPFNSDQFLYGELVDYNKIGLLVTDWLDSDNFEDTFKTKVDEVEQLKMGKVMKSLNANTVRRIIKK